MAKGKQKKCPRILHYFFVLAMLFLLFWVLFFGQNSFWNTAKLRKKVNKLEQEAQYLKAVNDSLAKENARLKTDPAAAEKAARELFGLTKPNEKVFRFVPAKEDKK